MQSPDNGRNKREAQPFSAGLLLFAEEVAGDEEDEDTEDAKEGDIAQMED